MKAKRSGPLPPEEEKRTQIALFRYGLIAPLLHRPLERGEIIAHLRACTTKVHNIPYSKRNTLTADTIWRYLAVNTGAKLVLPHYYENSVFDRGSRRWLNRHLMPQTFEPSHQPTCDRLLVPFVEVLATQVAISLVAS